MNFGKRLEIGIEIGKDVGLHARSRKVAPLGSRDPLT